MLDVVYAVVQGGLHHLCFRREQTLFTTLPFRRRPPLDIG